MVGSAFAPLVSAQPAPLRGWGVYVGASSLDYLRLAAQHTRAERGSPAAYTATGALSLSVAAGRVAFTYDMHGPAVVVDTGAKGPCT